MRNKFFVLISILLLFLFPIISAEIMISQPKTIYNLGEDFSIQLEVDNIKEGYFDVDLVCASLNESRENLYHGILTSEIIQIDRKLIPLYIGDLKGNCHIEANYDIDSATSQSFKISDEISLNFELRELNYNAGEAITVKGDATKESGMLVNGYIELKLGEETKATNVVSNGKFEVNFSTSENMFAKRYSLVVEIYDKDQEGNILNIGEGRADLVINQEASWIEVAIDKETISPGESITIIPYLHDKGNYEIIGEEVIIRITDDDERIRYEKIVNSGQEIVFTLESSHAAGYSKIIAEKEGEEVIGEKIFDVLERAKITAEMKNDSLVITNVGNVDYDKTVEINIGEETVLKKVTLAKGESKRYELTAPDGQYDLKIIDEQNTIYEGDVALTGSSIDMKEAGLLLGGLFSRYPLVWIFLIILIALVLLVMCKNYGKKKDVSFPVEQTLLEQKEKVPEHPTKKQEKEAKLVLDEEDIIKPGSITRAEQVLVLNGQKQNAGIVGIKIKNELTKEANKALSKILRGVKELRGVVVKSGENILVIFAPNVTKTAKNTESAIKAAQKIEQGLKEHNRKFKEKVEYGIAVHSGEIIGRVEEESFKFTSIGPSLNIAKKIAGISKGDLLLSKDAHRSSATDVKVESAIEESKANKMELFKVKRVIDNERNKKFIQDFLRRI